MWSLNTELRCLESTIHAQQCSVVLQARVPPPSLTVDDPVLTLEVYPDALTVTLELLRFLRRILDEQIHHRHHCVQLSICLGTRIQNVLAELQACLLD